MAILLRDLRLYGSATMPDDDSTQAIGGAISTAKKVEFVDVDGGIQAVSSSGSDTTQQITVHFRSSGGSLLNQAVTLSGLTPVSYGSFVERNMKVIKGATTVGDVAVEAQTPVRTNSAVGGDADTVTLDAAASGTDDAYLGMVIRLTGGTGVGQIRQIIAYTGSTKKAWVNRAWDTVPTGATSFRIAHGVVLEKTPNEITEVRRPFYNAAADPPGGSNRKFYEKVFYQNGHGTLALTGSQVKEIDDPSTLVAFALPATLDDTGTNGGGNNRQVAPGGLSFDSLDKNVANGQSLTAGSAQGVWLELTLNAGAAALKSTYTLGLDGQSAA